MTINIGTLNANAGEFANFMMTQYSPDKIEDLVLEQMKFGMIVPKETNWGGVTYNIPIYDGDPTQGLSPSFASGSSANALAAVTQGGQFALTAVKKYNQAVIDGELIAALKAKPDQFYVDKLDNILKGVVRQVGTLIENDLVGPAYLGQIATPQTLTGATSIALAHQSEANRFEVGMLIQAASATDGTAIRGTASNRVTAVDVYGATTQLTFATAVDDATLGWAAGDYLHIQGGFGQGISGLGTWLTTGSPGALFGVTRSTNKVRRSGVATTGSSSDVEGALIELADKIAEQGGKPTHAFMNYRNFTSLKKQLGAKVVYSVTPGVKSGNRPTSASTRGVVVEGSEGPIEIIPHARVAVGTIFMVELSSWILVSRDKLVDLCSYDGSTLARLFDSDGGKVQAHSYLQLGCKAPGHNGVCTLS